MQKNKRITQAFIIYWLLLLYTVAALVWWYVSLEKQNKERLDFEIAFLQKKDATVLITPANQEYNKLVLQKERRTTKHLSEGITFLVVIGIGAIFIYKLVKKQLTINKQQQNFIMAVTHELKTPIAIAKLNMETMQKRKLDEQQQQKLLQNTIVEMHRLNDLASNILIVSQIETGDYRMNKEPLDIAALLQSLVQEIKEQHPIRSIDLQIGNALTVNGDLLLLKLTFTNLLDNALKYSSKTDNVSIALEQHQVVIKDTGIGIAKEDTEKIFDKFYRVGNEMTRAKKGTGLGLYLCKKILNDHKATITLTNNTPKGSIFAVTFTT